MHGEGRKTLLESKNCITTESTTLVVRQVLLHLSAKLITGVCFQNQAHNSPKVTELAMNIDDIESEKLGIRLCS